METKLQRPKGRDGTLSSLNVAIEAMNLAKEVACITPAKAVFGSVSILLTMIRVRFPLSTTRCSVLTRGQDSMLNKLDYVDLGLACADVCGALDRGVNGRRLEDISQPVREAIEQLTMWVQPVTSVTCNPLTAPAIAEQQLEFKRGSSRNVGGVCSLGSPTRKMTRR